MTPFNLFKTPHRFNQTQTLILEHLEVVVSIVQLFNQMVEALGKGDWEEVEKLKGMVEEKETAADTIHRTNSEQICRGTFFAYLREDVLRLLEEIDGIADSVKDAGRTLTQRRLNPTIAKRFFTPQMAQYAKECLVTVEALREAVVSMSSKRETILGKIHQVETHEEKADSVKAEVLKQLYQEADQLDFLTFLQLREFIFQTDNIADYAEDASDVLLIMLAKGYT